MRTVGDKCNLCGKVVLKPANFESSDMVVTNASILYLGDLKEGEGVRPSLLLKDYPDREHHYCLDCFLEVVTRWVAAMKARGPSDISPENILLSKQAP